jgi:hypothetical protein
MLHGQHLAHGRDVVAHWVMSWLWSASCDAGGDEASCLGCAVRCGLQVRYVGTVLLVWS